MKGAVEATKNAATAIVRLPNTRVIQVSEVCARAPNGGSDCAAAAANGCRAKGFNGGTPLDVRTASHCDPKPPPQAGQMPTVQCCARVGRHPRGLSVVLLKPFLLNVSTSEPSP